MKLKYIILAILFFLSAWIICNPENLQREKIRNQFAFFSQWIRSAKNSDTSAKNSFAVRKKFCNDFAMQIQREFLTNANDEEIAQGIEIVLYYCDSLHILPAFAFAQIEHESGYNKNALGLAGEVGWFQLKPEACKDVNISFTDAKTDIKSNCKAGLLFLSKRINKGISAYNAGDTGAEKGYGRTYPLKIYTKINKYKEILKSYKYE